MSDFERALAHLEGLKKTKDGYQARCPSHDDKHQSLSISEKNGTLLLYCHAGCSFESIIRKLALPFENNNETPVITDTYDYTDACGNLLYQVVRYKPKSFRQRRPDGKDGWVWNLNGITPTLYHLPEVIKAASQRVRIFVVEGEKDVDNLTKAGLVATSISGGASTKWHPSLVPLFEGADVVIIPDQDEAGKKYASYVANLLYGWCSSLRVISLPAKDVSDFLLENELDKLVDIIDNTGQYIPSGAVTREEFNSFRGINLWLWRELKKRKRKLSKYE